VKNLSIPFDPYDFFGYLGSGLTVVLGMELVLGFPAILGRDLKAVELAGLVVAVYVAGQLVATPAKAVLEDGLVAGVLGRPNVNLFLKRRPPLRGRVLFRGFYTPVSATTRERVLERARAEGVDKTGEDLFEHVRFSPDVRNDEKLEARLNSFLNRYGFARNLAFASLTVGLALFVRAQWAAPDPALMKYAVVALVAGIALVYRYLKFFRQYSYELFNTWARGQKGQER
jgi:hypothetical protein